VDAGGAVVVYVEQALLNRAPAGLIDFHFGLLGRCTATVGLSRAG
jgi:hypothetical protein